MRRLALLAAFGLIGSLAHGSSASAQEACFTRLDNGVDLTGWRKSTTNHHGPGDGWTVENGSMVGRQTAGNKGGILMTEQSFKDVEVVFDVKVDWGCDSGFFFRTTAGDRAYQVTIDHLQGAGVGIVYGEGFAQELYYRPYTLTNMGNTAVKDPAVAPIFDLAQWPTIWKPTAFNEMRARVEGNPPRMQVWIAGVQVADFTDPKLRAEMNATGPLAIQVHVGADRWTPGGSVQFKNIRVRDLAVPCPDGGVDAGTDVRVDAAAEARADGASGAAGTTGSAGAGGSAGTGGAGSGAAGVGVVGTGGGSSAVAGATADGAAGVTGPAASPDTGGCGCATAPPRGATGAAVASLALALLARRPRYRAKSRHRRSL